MHTFTVTYCQEVVANTPEEAAIKAAQFLNEDFHQRYTELSLKTIHNCVTNDITPKVQFHLIGIFRNHKNECIIKSVDDNLDEK
jgi:hypothetical protein